MIKSLITPHTLNIKHKEHKTKELKNKITIDDKTTINTKETSKTDNNMASKNFPLTDSIDSQVNKLASENDISESKNRVLLSFLYVDEDLPTQEAVTVTTTTTTIRPNSTSIANTNSNTVNDSNSILIASSTITTAINNRANNENINNNIVNNSNKLLTPSSTTTTTTNGSKISANANNLVNNTSSNLIPSRIDEESNECEECGNTYAAQQVVKENVLVSNY